MNESVIEFLKEIDGSKCFTYFYMCIFATLIIMAIYFLIAITITIFVSKSRNDFLSSLDEKTKYKILEYKHINIFNCFSYLKKKKYEKNGKVY